jgi:hypothetical protein
MFDFSISVSGSGWTLIALLAALLVWGVYCKGGPDQAVLIMKALAKPIGAWRRRGELSQQEDVRR